MNQTARVLNAIENLYDKHLVYPSREERDAAVVWTAASWVAESFDNFPRLYFRAAEYGAGKSVAAEAVGRLTREFHDLVGATPSVVYRLIENSEKKPVVFIDEADNVFGTAGSSSSHQELLAVLNKGFHRQGKVYRSRGQDDVKEFRCFAPMILAGKGILPKALMTRSVTVSMRKPTPGETYVPYRHRVHAPFFDGVRKALDDWSGAVGSRLGASFPEMPDAIKDRDRDVWEPLVAVADLADGSEWGERIRKAAVILSSREDIKEAVPAGTQLVKTLARMFRDSDRVAQSQVAEELGWTTRDVGKLAREMELHPVSVSVNGSIAKGFKKEHYEELFNV